VNRWEKFRGAFGNVLVVVLFGWAAFCAAVIVASILVKLFGR
jgi:hypothetical protein